MSTVDRISGDPLKSLGAGFLILILTPLTAALLMAIVVGFWVGLSIMALYLVALIVGYLSACFFVSDWAARRFNKDISTTGRRFISVALAIIVLGLLSNIPLIGGLLNLYTFAAGAWRGDDAAETGVRAISRELVFLTEQVRLCLFLLLTASDIACIDKLGRIFCVFSNRLEST